MVIKEKLTILDIMLGFGSFIVAIFHFWFLGITAYSLIIKYDKIRLNELFSIAFFSVIAWFIAKNMWRFFLKFLVPSVYCTRYIKKYINRKELKKLLENEKFEEIAIIKNNVGEFDFYASENWLYINRLYIPKAMILTVNFTRETNRLELLNKKNVNINSYTTNDSHKFCNEIQKTKKIIPNAYLVKSVCPYSVFEKKYTQKFLDEIKTKDDFFNLVKNNYFFTEKEIEKEFLTEPLMEEKRKYFYDENGNYCEEYTNALGEIFIYKAEEGKEDNL